jgi:hypothetical protein
MIETDSTGAPVEVDDLDPDWLLALAAESETQSRQAERRKLRLAHRWCVLNPATVETGIATWSEAGREALDCDEALGGDGTPLVAAFAPEQLGAALGCATSHALQLMADALNLRHRLPRTWAMLEALELPAWRAQRLARATSDLSRPAALHVDRELAPVLGSAGAVTIDRAIAEARARYEPEELDDAEHRARANWDVRLRHAPADLPHGGWAGTSWLDATGDTLDLTRFHDLVCAVAEQLKQDGDTDDLAIRKAKAIGVITDQATRSDSDTGSRRRDKIRLYLHLASDDLDPSPDDGHARDDDDGVRVGTAERLGPATLDKIRSWLEGTHTTLTPVLDLARTDAVDRHDPPEWMRELVILRDRRCRFPWCTRDARHCDLDHVIAYDENGPPDQTRPENLAPLCRRHHRGKTSGRWRYRRNRDGTYTWHSPTGRTYLVTDSATSTIG